MPTSIPRAIKQRTCIGCRTVAHSSDLLRFAAIEGNVFPDERANLGGRGAWVHPTAECLKQALAKKAFNRAFKGAVGLEHVQALLEMTTGRPAPRDESG
ncbi:YlxR family protein [Trueperella bialowiezensis]|uniref:Protein of uncharacterized function (DUF448) n=1 Tax=Trueperella bialowiezensis TaxID=312285 RepID=A0A448PCI4_9ACTO|nr:YlxR family protein [Trueperella bialowiezensis]VEI12661.1 Protein of uncharacterised function (DUF448) [Trueperella bialowiezensis]